MVRGNPRGRMTPAWTKSTVDKLLIGGGLPVLEGKLAPFPA